MLNLVNAVYLYITCNILTPFLAIHPEMFVENLKYMGLGMLCIIIVMAVIICVVIALNKASSAVARRKAEKENSGKNQ